MALTLLDIQQRVASLVDQSTTESIQGGSEWNLRTLYTNRAIEEWSQAFDWECLRKDYWPGITGGSMASISMPDDFRKPAGYPLYHSCGISGGDEWTVIRSGETGLYTSTDKYCYFIGNRADGHTMVWNPGTMASGASVRVAYYSHATSLASPANEVIVPNPEFVVNRVTAYIFESRSDARFQETEVKARENLLEMINETQTSKYNPYGGGEAGNVQTTEKSLGFRIGRD